MKNFKKRLLRVCLCQNISSNESFLWNKEDFKDHVKWNLAKRIAEELLEKDYIKFEEEIHNECLIITAKIDVLKEQLINEPMPVEYSEVLMIGDKKYKLIE